MRSLADELSERLMMDQTANKRRAKTITVSVRLDGDERWTSLSRSCSLPSYSAERITQVAISLIQHTNEAPPKDSVWSPAIKNISLSAGKFEDWAGASSGSIQEMFKKVAKANITSTVPSSLVTDWHWLFNLGKGVDTEQVTSRQLPKSIGCGKNFHGKEALNTQEKVQKWMRSLADELSERLMMDQTANKRRAKTITVSVRLDGDERWTSLSRSCSLPSYSAERITQVAISLIQHTNEAPPKDSVWLVT
ncbi:putative DNA polymerase eta [Penaeus vannamei]|uniref:Putative DNA polymerase eta n=1 Tax=Penaeus vannamei TaxID=6689 RepID=A0A423THW9_PENVA|nr:putative DNA polymerase eta [Penaeus vannamei]